MNYRCEGEGI